jgi:hypothetical protein
MSGNVFDLHASAEEPRSVKQLVDVQNPDIPHSQRATKEEHVNRR